MWDTILFDLDGTLTDSQEGIVNAAVYSLNYFGIQEKREKILRFIGPPLHETFRETYGFDSEKTRIGTDRFHEYFDDRGWRENAVYPGVENLLKELKSAGKRLLVATSKPEWAAIRILEHFGLAQYFDHICGAPKDEREGGTKAQVIANALSYLDNHDDIVMVGDRKHDVQGAREMGLPAVGILYGYGDREELEDAEADFIAKDIEELGDLLLFDTRIMQKWREAFAPECDKRPCWPLTEALFCGRVPALHGKEAQDAFDRQEYETAIIFRCCRAGIHDAGITAKISASELAQEDADLCVTDRDFRWTYAQTKRGHGGLRAFYKIENIENSGEIDYVERGN